MHRHTRSCCLEILPLPRNSRIVRHEFGVVTIHVHELCGPRSDQAVTVDGP